MKNLFSSSTGGDDGMRRRFSEANTFVFEDYSAGELSSIFQGLLKKKNAALKKAAVIPPRPPKKAANPSAPKEEPSAPPVTSPPFPEFEWRLEDSKLADIIGVRVARGRGKEGFGNAGKVEELFNGEVLGRYNARYHAAAQGHAKDPTMALPAMGLLTKADVLGPKPDPSTSKSYQELMGLPGTEAVKRKAKEILDFANRSWTDEEAGRVPDKPPCLNFIFAGPPGTFKTTAARFFGGVLRECGLLTKGELLERKPSHFIGSVLGETEKKTAGELKEARSNVLFLDEAYGLMGGASAQNSGNQFAQTAQSEICAGVSPDGGADMAVILAGCVCFVWNKERIPNFLLFLPSSLSP